jgi:hypothetical protein
MGQNLALSKTLGKEKQAQCKYQFQKEQQPQKRQNNKIENTP